MMMFSLLPSSACRVQLKLPLQTVVPSTTQNLWCMLPPAPSRRTSRPAARSSLRWEPPPTCFAWRSSVTMRTRTPRLLASLRAAFSSATVSVKTATSRDVFAERISAKSILKFASMSSGKNRTIWSPLHLPVGAGPGSLLMPGARAPQRRSNSAEKTAATLADRLMTMFSQLFIRAPVVQFREPFTQTSPSTTANLWCICSLLLSRRTSMPAFRSFFRSELSKASSASLSARTRTLTPALCWSVRTEASRSSVSTKRATSRLLEAEERTSTRASTLPLPQPGR
mmetsp:Transcript_35967/g.111741  ORF Transcript_35967/g.111741 Transcript_35967/m.111741 type:complete len:283 (-) Transcript_35967:646-1494(-)